MARRRLVPLSPVLVALLAACSSAGSPPPSAPGPTSPAASVAASNGAAPSIARTDLTIYGAASLKGVLERAKAAWEAANPGSTLTIATDSSAALETQIELGAPADVFLSADATNPQKLVDKGLAVGDPIIVAGNELSVIVPAPNPARIASPADLAKPGLKVIAAGDAVPITRYATQLVANLATEAGYPAGFAAAYAANVVSKEDNVQAIVAKIELAEGDAGIVYLTDATASTKIARIDVPRSANVAATYAGVVVKASPNAAAAQAFLDWFAGPAGQAILAGFGFRPPS